MTRRYNGKIWQQFSSVKLTNLTLCLYTHGKH